MVHNQVIEFSEGEIETKRRQLRQYEHNLARNKAMLRRYEQYLETGITLKRFLKETEDMKEMIKSGKDAEGKEIDELSIEEFKIEVDCRKLDYEDELPKIELISTILKTKEDVKINGKNIKVLEKHIRERKVVVQQND